MDTKFPFTNTEDYDREDSTNFDIPNISIEPAMVMPQSNNESNGNFMRTGLHLPPDIFSGHHRNIAEDYSSGSDYTPSPSTSYRSLSPVPVDSRALQHDFDQSGDYGEQLQYSEFLLDFPLGNLHHSQSSDSIHSLGSTNTSASGSGHYITPASSLGPSMEKLGTCVDSLDIDSTEPQGVAVYNSGHSRTVIPQFTASDSRNNSTGVSIRDMLTLLLESGSSMASKDPDDIRKEFISQLMMSGNQLPVVNDFSKPTKMEIGTAATLKASNLRRKCEATFVCELCTASFTRKNGVMNHYRSHLGIADKRCMFCKRGFTTSLGRHIKKCKSNPNRSKAPLKKEVQ